MYAYNLARLAYTIVYKYHNNLIMGFMDNNRLSEAR